MSFAENLIRARKNARYSQQQLSARSGISQQAISKLENGKSSPSIYTTQRLATALRISIHDLLDENPPTPEEDNALRTDIMNRVQLLSEPVLVRLSDFLDGIEAANLEKEKE